MSTDRKVNEFVVPSKPGLNGKTIFIPFGQKEGTTEVEGKLSAWLQRFVNNRISNLNGEPNQGRLEITGVTAFEIFDQLERDHLVIDKLFMIFFNRKFPNKEDLFPFAGLEIDPSGKVNNRSLATQVLSNVRPLEEEDNLKDKYIGPLVKKYGNLHKYYIADFTNEKSIQNLIKSMKKDLVKIDVLINSAGIGVYKPFPDVGFDELRDSFYINVKIFCSSCSILLWLKRWR